MNVEKIKNAKTKVIGKNVQYYKKIDSTHLYSKRNANNIKNGTIILADFQEAGIGTKGRSWYTGTGKNIAMTIFLKPKCNPNQLKFLTLDIAKSMKEAIYNLYKINLDIKEPNDLMINSKKISGILTQINTIGENINYLLISIGFNVNEDEFPEETKLIATSLKREYKKEFCREEIILRFIEILENKIKNLL